LPKADFPKQKFARLAKISLPEAKDKLSKRVSQKNKKFLKEERRTTTNEN
jgi:hypothetical protein